MDKPTLDTLTQRLDRLRRFGGGRYGDRDIPSLIEGISSLAGHLPTEEVYREVLRKAGGSA